MSDASGWPWKIAANGVDAQHGQLRPLEAICLWARWQNREQRMHAWFMLIPNVPVLTWSSLMRSLALRSFDAVRQRGCMKEHSTV